MQVHDLDDISLYSYPSKDPCSACTDLISSAVADHDEKASVVRLNTIVDQGRYTWVELLPHDGNLATASALLMRIQKLNKRLTCAHYYTYDHEQQRPVDF